jgi:hypothetical protein
LESAYPLTVDAEEFLSLLLGPVTAKVLHDATCPVWTAAHAMGSELSTESHAETPLHAACRSMLCAFDLKTGSDDLLRRALDVAGGSAPNCASSMRWRPPRRTNAYAIIRQAPCPGLSF